MSHRVRILAALFAAFIQTRLPLATSSSVIGNAFLDLCWNARSNARFDEPIKQGQVTVNCTINSVDKLTFIVATGVTNDDGSFAIPMDDNSRTTFLEELQNGNEPTIEMFPRGSLSHCVVMIKCDKCDIRTLENGKCMGGGMKGNGVTRDVDLVNVGPNTAYIRINSPVCYSPGTRLGTCPAYHQALPGATGDPHFTGADGSRFDFEGEPNATFCVVSDAHIHINAYFGGRWEPYAYGIKRKSLTWIRKLAILWGHHTIVLATREGSRWQYDNGYMASIEFDGQNVELKRAGDLAMFVGGVIQVRWLAARVQSGDDLIDIYEVTIADILRMRVKVRPEIELLRTERDGVIHLDMEFPVLSVSEAVHGILGQTFRADHRNRLSAQKLVWNDILRTYMIPGDNAEGFLDGDVSKYKASGLTHADCKYSQFAAVMERDTGAQAVGSATQIQNTNGKMNRKDVRTVDRTVDGKTGSKVDNEDTRLANILDGIVESKFMPSRKFLSDYGKVFGWF